MSEHFTVRQIASIFVLCGVLVACSPVQTPVAVATATVIASTATITPTPTTPTPIPPPSVTPIILPTDAITPLTPILGTDIDYSIELVQALIDDLATWLDIRRSRVQFVSVEAGEWDAASLGCTLAPEMATRMAINASEENIIEGYRFVLLVGTRLYVYHTAGTERYHLCDEDAIISDEILLAVDPLAEEILRVVQSQLANDLDLPSRRVQLMTMQPVIWQDTSLGCPQPDQTYTEREIPGYHIVVQVGNEQFVYHSDSNTAYACAIEFSIIPIEAP